jgi:hypothetical protein
LAFNLDPLDPVPNLLLREVSEFFVPGFGDIVRSSAMYAWWERHTTEEFEQERNACFDDEYKYGLLHIGLVCFKMVKFIGRTLKIWRAILDETIERQKRLAQEDVVMTDAGSGESKTYSEWVAHARRLSEQMWQRFQESGQDGEGDLDDEPWALIA